MTQALLMAELIFWSSGLPGSLKELERFLDNGEEL
jgi:hypothetical protein